MITYWENGKKNFILSSKRQAKFVIVILIDYGHGFIDSVLQNIKKKNQILAINL